MSRHSSEHNFDDVRNIKFLMTLEDTNPGDQIKEQEMEDEPHTMSARRADARLDHHLHQKCRKPHHDDAANESLDLTSAHADCRAKARQSAARRKLGAKAPSLRTKHRAAPNRSDDWALKRPVVSL